MTDASVVRTSPFIGLLPFGTGDARYFFGRETETEVLFRNVLGIETTLLYGQSGVGKSSVINAGLLPSLLARDDVIPVAFSAWSDNPVPDLKAAVEQAATRRIGGFEANEGESLGRLLWRVAETLAEVIENPDELVQRPGRVVVILDQLDELVINYSLTREARGELQEAFARPHPSLGTLLSIREDWLARLDAFRSMFPGLLDNLIRIEPLSVDGAVRAIRGPLERFEETHPGVGPSTAADDLVEKLIKQVRRRDHWDPLDASRAEPGTTIDTAFLQVVLIKLWQVECERESRRLQLTTLDELGSASRILDGHMATVFDQLDEEQQVLAVEMFDRLVTPSETKVAQSAEDLASYLEADEAVLEEILQLLAKPDARVLRSFAPRDRPETKRYELYHDLLASPVRSWLMGRRMEARVLKLLERRDSNEAEASRLLLRRLFHRPAPVETLVVDCELPQPTVAEITGSLIENGVLTENRDRLEFSPGRGFREAVIDEPRDELLGQDAAWKMVLILSAAAVATTALGVAAVLYHPIGTFGELTIGKITDSLLMLVVGAALGATWGRLVAWYRLRLAGLASAKKRKGLGVPMVVAPLMSGAGLTTFFCIYGLFTGDWDWLRGGAMFVWGVLAIIMGAFYASDDFLKSL